ncbi:MAG: HIT domain-containing protein [Nanoarchaeota archaeon]|nr:HIT domain-containing protein [Nanoarchaeota archaeon]MBU4308344.1 HIT domain-containing protein [Nanoarchaeota archaeon]
MEKDCVFCKIVKGEVPCEKIWEDDNFISVFDAHPEVEGHSLIISKKHFETVLDLPSSLGTELLDCIKKTSLKLIEKYKAEGFNIINNNFGAGQQVVKHFHVHVLPRKKGDGLRLKLMDGEKVVSR